MNLKRLSVGLFAAVSVLYPVAVYVGVQRFGPTFFAVVMLVLAVGRYSLGRDRTGAQSALLAVAAIYSLVLAVSGSQLFLKLYPAVMSTCIGTVFLLSVFQSQSLIERLVRVRGGNITRLASRYTRKLTLLWALLLYANAAVALYFAAFGSLEQWALYCGLLAYVFFALFAGLEYLYRRYYIRKHEGSSHAN